MDTNSEAYKYISDRIQKITTALYRVTDLFSDKEPLKWTLRDTAIELHSSLMSIRTKQNEIANILDGIQQIVYTLELTSAGTSISSLNFEILKKEYLNLKSFIEGEKDNLVPEQKLLVDSIGQSNGQTIGHRMSNRTSDVHNALSNTLSDRNNGQEYNGQKEARKIQSLGRLETERKILDFIRKNGKNTISDIVVMFNGQIGDKTVQRCLLELVNNGKLLAEGEKRWRTYSIVPQSL